MTANRNLSPVADLARAMKQGNVIDITTLSYMLPDPLSAILFDGTPHLPIANPHYDGDTGLLQRLFDGDLPMPADIFTASWTVKNQTVVLHVFPGEHGRSLRFTSFCRTVVESGAGWTTDLAVACVENGRIRFSLRPHACFDDQAKAVAKVSERIGATEECFLAALDLATAAEVVTSGDTVTIRLTLPSA